MQKLKLSAMRNGKTTSFAFFEGEGHPLMKPSAMRYYVAQLIKMLAWSLPGALTGFAISLCHANTCS